MMTCTVRKFGVGVASLALVASMAVPALAADPVDGRLAGADRYDTAISIAMFDAEFGQSPSMVYVARGDMLIDAVTAGTLKGGPLLLVNDTDSVKTKVAEAIKKLAPGKVVVIGGEKAVSADTVKAIVPAGVSSERVAGDDRYATSALIADLFAKQTKKADFKRVYLANGASYIDALVGGMVTDGPILLTGKDMIPAATQKALNKIGAKPLRALGGPMVVSQAVLKQGGVNQVILPDTYVEDFQKEVKAAALADLKVNGYVTAAPKVSLDQIKKAAGLDKAGKEVEAAKLTATFPRLDRELVKSANGSLFAGKDADDKTIAVAYADTQAAGDNAYSEDGNPLSYAGTKTVFDNTKGVNDDLDAEFSKIDAQGNANIFKAASDSGKDQNAALASANEDTNFKVDVLAKVFPGKFDSNTSLADFLKNVGVPVGTDDTTTSGKLHYTTSEATAAATKWGELVDVAKIGMPARVVESKAANDAALKGQKDADKALATKISAKPINTDVNRLAGADRYGTALAVAQDVFGDKGQNGVSNLYFANGEGTDAAVAGMLAKGPVLLVAKDQATAGVKAYVGAVAKAQNLMRKNGIMLGGAAVIDDKNRDALLDEISKKPAGNEKYAVNFVTAPTVGDEGNGTKVDFTANGPADRVKVDNIPNGGTVKYGWEYNDGTGWKTIVEKDATGETTVGTNAKFTGSNTLKLVSTAATGTAKPVQVRLVVRVVNSNGEDMEAPVRSTTYEIKK